MGFGTDFENLFFSNTFTIPFILVLLLKFPVDSLNFMQNCIPILGVLEKMTRGPSHESLALINC